MLSSKHAIQAYSESLDHEFRTRGTSESTNEAMAYVDKGHARGKVVVKVR
jgi:hypothetical protein